MTLSYCNGCVHHGTVEIQQENHSRCEKENCLSVYAKCVSEEAIRQFINNNGVRRNQWTNSALEICYSSA